MEGYNKARDIYNSKARKQKLSSGLELLACFDSVQREMELWDPTCRIERAWLYYIVNEGGRHALRETIRLELPSPTTPKQIDNV